MQIRVFVAVAAIGLVAFGTWYRGTIRTSPAPSSRTTAVVAARPALHEGRAEPDPDAERDVSDQARPCLARSSG